MKVISLLGLGLAFVCIHAHANQNLTPTLEGALLQSVPKGYSILFVKGVDSEKKVTLDRSGNWQQRVANVAARANTYAEIDETTQTVRVIPSPATVSASKQPPVPSTQQAGTTEANSFELLAQPGELLSVALRRSLHRHDHTLIWNLKTDLEVSVAYARRDNTLAELCHAVMRDYNLVGTLFSVNRVLVVADPAIKE